MKNQKIRSLSIAIFSAAFAFVLSLSSVQEVSAQRYLTEIKSTAEVKGISQFAADLSEFLKLAEFIEQENIASPVQLARLERAGKKVKDGAGSFRNNLKGLITNLKNSKRWDEQLDSEINDSLGNRKIKVFFQRNGGRKLLTEGENAINAISNDVDTIINNTKKQQSLNLSVEGIFMKTSFSSSGAKKIKFKCVILGIGIFGAELVGAKLTAENLDKIFDKSCGAGATPAT